MRAPSSLFLSLLFLLAAVMGLRSRKFRILATFKTPVLPIVQTHGLELTDSLRQDVREKVNKVFKKVNKVLSSPMSRRVLNARVLLKFDSSQIIRCDESLQSQTCEIVCSMKDGEMIKATQSSDDMHRSIDLAVFSLAQSLKMYSCRIHDYRKEKIAKVRRHNLGIALCQASYDNNLPQVNALLAAGADVSYVMEAGPGKCHSPLQVAALNEHIDVIHALIAAGANVNQICPQSISLLRQATVLNNTRMLSALISAGADVNNFPEFSAVNIAARCGYTEALRLLLDAGAIIREIDLLAATYLGHVDCITALLERGYDPFSIRSALGVAVECGHPEAVAAIRAHLAQLEENQGKGKGENDDAA